MNEPLLVEVEVSQPKQPLRQQLKRTTVFLVIVIIIAAISLVGNVVIAVHINNLNT